MELKPGYKQTDIGVIPEDWDAVPLRRTCRAIYRGASPRPIGDPRWFDQGSDIGWVRISDVTRSRRYLRETTQRLSEEGIKRSRFIPRGSLIMSICATVGRPIETAVNTCIHDGFVVFEKPGIDQGFLYHVLCDLEPRWATKGQTGSQMNLNTNLIKITSIPLPPTAEEQRAIATALSDVDTLLDGLNRLIAKKRDIKQAAMQQLLTGKTRLPGFEGEWEYRSLIEIAEFQKSNFDDGDWVEAEHITDKGIRLIQTGNIGTGSFVEKEVRKYIYEQSFIKLRCKELRVGDILICRLAEPAGRACIFPNIGEERVITSVDVTIFRPREEIADRRFIVQYCSTENWFKSVLDNVGGTTHKRISRGALGKLLIPFPSIREQTAIATVLSDMDAEIATLEQRRAKTKNIKQAMMQELLTGKTRLVAPGGSNA